MTDSNLRDLDPLLQPIAQICLDTYASTYPARHPARITVTWRSPEDQQKAYNAGLSNAKVGESKHECCLADGTPASRAFDWACFTDDGNYIADGTHPYYADFAAIVKDNKLIWGGDYLGDFKDWDHAEMPD